MADNQALYQQLEALLSGSLTDAEVAELKNQLAKDPALKTEAQHYMTGRASIDLMGRTGLRSRLSKLGDQLIQEQQTSHRPLYSIQKIWPYAVAAVIVLLLLFFLPQQNANNWTSDELTTYIQNDLPVPGLRGTDPMDSLWALGADSYLAQNYPQAIDSWSQYLNQQADPEGFLYLGISFLMTKQPEAAIQSLDRIPVNSLYEAQKQWYRALALIQSEQISAAMQALEIIAENSTHYKQAEAKEILQRLK